MTYSFIRMVECSGMIAVRRFEGPKMALSDAKSSGASTCPLRAGAGSRTGVLRGVGGREHA